MVISLIIASVRCGILKNGFTLKLDVEGENVKSSPTRTSTTGLESIQMESSLPGTQKDNELYRYNSLLDPKLAVYDLDTMNINPNIFDDGES